MNNFPFNPDKITYTIYLTGLRSQSRSLICDQGEISQTVIDDILSSGVALDTKLLTAMLRLPAHGLPAKVLARIESAMSKNETDVVAMNALLESRWRAGFLSDGAFAAAVASKITEAGLEPDFKTLAHMLQQHLQGVGRSDRRAMAAKIDSMLLEALALADTNPKVGNYEFLLWICVLRVDIAGALGVYSRMLVAGVTPTERTVSFVCFMNIFSFPYSSLIDIFIHVC